MIEEKPCVACESMFLTSALSEDGRCSSCRSQGLVAGLTPETDYIKSEAQKRADLKATLKELLAELKEEERLEKQGKKFGPRECKRCGNVFVPNTPANTVCEDCK